MITSTPTNNLREISSKNHGLKPCNVTSKDTRQELYTILVKQQAIHKNYHH